MREYDREYPGYGFAENKGYGTLGHREALRRLGPCPIHRRSFTLRDHLPASRPLEGLPLRYSRRPSPTLGPTTLQRFSPT